MLTKPYTLPLTMHIRDHVQQSSFGSPPLLNLRGTIEDANDNTVYIVDVTGRSNVQRARLKRALQRAYDSIMENDYD